MQWPYHSTMTGSRSLWVLEQCYPLKAHAIFPKDNGAYTSWRDPSMNDMVQRHWSLVIWLNPEVNIKIWKNRCNVWLPRNFPWRLLSQLSFDLKLGTSHYHWRNQPLVRRCIRYLVSSNQSSWWVLFILCKWGSWDSEKLNNCSKATIARK